LENRIALQTLIDYYEDFEDCTRDNRKLCERDRDYYDNKQYTADELATFAKRKQPAIVYNRIKAKVDFTLGLERQIRTDPKAYPRTPMHEKDAESVTDSIRYVTENNNYDQKRSSTHKNMQIEGTGGYEINVTPSKKGFEITVIDIDWDRMWYDPHSRRDDYSDAIYKGIVIWMDEDKALHKFGKDKADILKNSYDDSMEETFADKPSTKWGDRKRKRVKICYINFQHEGKWHIAYFTKGGYLIEPKVSPFLDEDGEPVSNLEFQSAFVDREGNRYGGVRQLIGPQDEINKRRSKYLHQSSSRQTYGNKQAIPEPNELKRELHKPDGHVEIQYGEFGKDFGIIPTGDMEIAQFNLLQEAKNEIDSVGVNAAMSGKEERNMSGRALIARSQQGTTEIGPILDGLRSLDLRTYRTIWNMVRQFWKDEKWIRVTDDERNLKWVGINQKVRVKDKIIEEHGGIPPELEGDPRLEQVVEIQNQLSELDVDIIIDDMPDTVTIQQEQLQMVSEIAMQRPEIPIDAVVELTSLRNKEQLIERIKGSQEQQQQAGQMEQMHHELDMADKEAEIRNKNAKAVKDESEAMINQAEIQYLVQGG